MNTLRRTGFNRVILISCNCAKSINFTCTRNLSATQTATALRPFYFAVHPDLFGRYPKAREVNEDSLKILSEYLNGLRTQRKVRPVSLLFYVKSSKPGDKEKLLSGSNQEEPDILTTVRISLLSENIRSTVSSILRSCNLSLDYVNSVKSDKNLTSEAGRTGSPGRPIKWDHTYYTFYGIPNPEAHKFKSRPTVNTLSSWLEKNINKAKKHQTAYEGIRADTARLKKQLQDEYGLVSVKWSSGWGLTQYRASLRGLIRVLKENSSHIDLKGQSLVFGHANGMCLRGNVIVKSDDLADTWIPLLKSVSIYTAIFKKLPAHENVLSSLLNNINVVRRVGSPYILAGEYLDQLKQLSNSLERYYLESDNNRLTTGDLRDVDLVVECAEGPIHLSSSGQILIPSRCPAFLIVDYLIDNADTARQMKSEFQKRDKVVLQLVKKCKERLELESLSKEPNITCEQLETFCKKLLKDPHNIGVSLSGCRIKVAQFYSVMSDGEMYIPWNWKGTLDEQD